MAHRGADAVGAGVAAADDDDVLALGVDEVAVGELLSSRLLRVLVQELHGEVDALELAPFDRQSRAAGVAPLQSTMASNSLRSLLVG